MQLEVWSKVTKPPMGLMQIRAELIRRTKVRRNAAHDPLDAVPTFELNRVARELAAEIGAELEANVHGLAFHFK